MPCGTQIAPFPASFSIPGLAGVLFPSTFSQFSAENDIRWFGTIRGRLGITTGPAMWYVTGGVAYADIQRSYNIAGTTTLLGALPLFTWAGQSGFSSVRWGGTVGTGVEAQLAGGFSVKAEWLWMDFRNLSDPLSSVINTSILGIGVGTTLGNHLFSTDYRVNVFRIGLNYKFGDDYLPALLAK